MIIFISGGITDVPNYQENFNNMANLLKAKGHIPLNPACFPKGLENKDYMSFGFKMLNCADAIMMLNNWQNSKGATLEFQYANYLNMPIFYEYAIDELDKLAQNNNIIVATNLFNECETHHNCTVEIWKNTYTNEISIGWFEVEKWHKLDKDHLPDSEVIAFSNHKQMVGYISYDEENDCYSCFNVPNLILTDVTHWRELDEPAVV